MSKKRNSAAKNGTSFFEGINFLLPILSFIQITASSAQSIVTGMPRIFLTIRSVFCRTTLSS